MKCKIALGILKDRGWSEQSIKEFDDIDFSDLIQTLEDQHKANQEYLEALYFAKYNRKELLNLIG